MTDHKMVVPFETAILIALILMHVEELLGKLKIDMSADDPSEYTCKGGNEAACMGVSLGTEVLDPRVKAWLDSFPAGALERLDKLWGMDAEVPDQPMQKPTPPPNLDVKTGSEVPPTKERGGS